MASESINCSFYVPRGPRVIFTPAEPDRPKIAADLPVSTVFVSAETGIVFLRTDDGIMSLRDFTTSALLSSRVDRVLGRLSVA